MTVRELSRRDARRLTVRAQLLDRPWPTGLLDVVRQLTLLQIDPVDVPFDRTMTAAVDGEIKDPGSLARTGPHAARLRGYLNRRARDVALACAALSFCGRFGAGRSGENDAKATKACIQVFSRLFACVTLTESRLAATPASPTR